MGTSKWYYKNIFSWSLKRLCTRFLREPDQWPSEFKIPLSKCRVYNADLAWKTQYRQRALFYLSKWTGYCECEVWEMGNKIYTRGDINCCFWGRFPCSDMRSYGSSASWAVLIETFAATCQPFKNKVINLMVIGLDQCIYFLVASNSECALN